MNREEAINIISQMIKDEEGFLSDDTVEAHKMAIKALEQEPCGNAIDRAEAIKIASGYCHPANVAKELAKLPPVNPQPCEDAISREETLTAFADYVGGGMSMDDYDALWNIVAKMPAVTPQPKTGRWIAYEVRLPDRTILNYRCSVCGRKLIGYSTETLSEAPFCHCGAKMVEPQERSDKG